MRARRAARRRRRPRPRTAFPTFAPSIRLCIRTLGVLALGVYFVSNTRHRLVARRSLPRDPLQVVPIDHPSTIGVLLAAQRTAEDKVECGSVRQTQPCRRLHERDRILLGHVPPQSE